MKNIRSSPAKSKAVEELIERYIELFAAQIHAFPEMEELLNSASSLEEHNRLVREHLTKTYGEISAFDAFELSHKVGQSHIDNEVRLSWYLTTYNKIFEAYHATQHEGSTVLPDLDEFRAVWMRDAGDTLDSYYDLLIQQHTSENQRLQESINELDIQAKTDPLTEILNRRGFRAEIDKTLMPGLFVLLDLDNFKSVNDLQGHIVGDSILQKVARGLASQLRKGDLVGRIGGDEFAVWLPTSSEMTKGEIKNAIQRILSDIPFDEWNIGISGGIVQRPKQAQTFDDLYAKADAALYKAKLNGDFTIRMFASPEKIDIRPSF